MNQLNQSVSENKIYYNLVITMLKKYKTQTNRVLKI